MEKPFRIGIWTAPETDPGSGGSHYYIKAVRQLLLESDFGKDIELVPVGYDIKELFPGRECISFKALHDRLLKKILWSLYSRVPVSGPQMVRSLRDRHEEACTRVLKELEIELMFQPWPGVEFKNFPFVATHWDTGHLSTYSFPEVAVNGTFESRQLYHNKILKKALLVCCESQAGKKELEDLLSIPPQRVEVVDLFPGEVIEPHVVSTPVPPLEGSRFFFYPASYSPHKNHYNLLRAFALFLERHPGVKLVFTGNPLKNKKYIDQTIDTFGLQGAVIQLGVVPVGELKWLYEQAMAMVMPTLLGPTNMPLPEARYFNCPVACTGLAGHREQLGGYAHYFDGLDAQDILKALESVVAAPRPALQPVTPQMIRERIFSQLQAVFRKAKSVRRTWGMNDEVI